jgi:hypothetical protein
MKRLWEYIFRRTKIGKWLNEKKTYLGGAMVLVVAVLQIAKKLLELFPEWTFLIVIIEGITTFLELAGPWLEGVGIPLFTAGVIDWKVKENK